jgi:hypothetical protein
VVGSPTTSIWSSSCSQRFTGASLSSSWRSKRRFATASLVRGDDLSADMATRMRVILSPGGKSKPSIIQSLGADKVPLLSTCPPISENALWASGGLYTQGSPKTRTAWARQVPRAPKPLFAEGKRFRRWVFGQRHANAPSLVYIQTLPYLLALGALEA